MKTAIVAVLIAVGLYFYGHHVGWEERNAEMQAEIAAKNEEARAKEQELNQKLNDNEAKLLEVNNAINEKQSALDRAIRAGRVRLPSSCVQTSSSASPAPSGGDASSSESDRETLAAIAAIVAEGDRNTEQLNACIAAYNDVRSQINGQR